MRAIELIKEFFIVFIVTFIVVSLVTYLYGLVIYSGGTYDWATAFRFSITLGIIFPWLQYRKGKNINNNK